MDPSTYKQSVNLTIASINQPVVIKEIYCEPGTEVKKGIYLFKYEYEKPKREIDEDTLVEGKVKGYDWELDYFVSNYDGIVDSVNINVEDRIEDIKMSVITLKVKCKHDLVLFDCCAHCGETLPNFVAEESLKSFSHTQTNLKVTNDGAKRLAKEHITRLSRARKLIMVIDLDQTIIQASVNTKIGEWMKDETNINYEVLQDVKSFTLPGSDLVYYIKFRQGLMEFLDLVKNLYELHIYTMGNRPYASAVVNLIDPEGIYFVDRIISRDESGSVHKKSLERLFPGDSSMVIMLDDRPDVWDWSPQLVRVPPFEFFGDIDINAGPLEKKNKLKNGTTSNLDPNNPTIVVDAPEEVSVLKNDEVLSRIITPVVKEIHRRFYSQKYSSDDFTYEIDMAYREPKKLHAARVLGKLKHAVLSGVHLVFTGIFPSTINLKTDPLCRWAQEFGATCSHDLTVDTTHLIAKEFTTVKAKKALSVPSIKIVHINWLWDSLYYYNRQDETPYLVEKPPGVTRLEANFPKVTRLTPTPPLDGDTSLADLDPYYLDPNAGISEYDSNENSAEEYQANDDLNEDVEPLSDNFLIDTDKWEENMKGAYAELEEMDISSDDGEYEMGARDEDEEGDDYSGESQEEREVKVDKNNLENLSPEEDAEVNNGVVEEEDDVADGADFLDQLITMEYDQVDENDLNGNKRTTSPDLTSPLNKLSRLDPTKQEAGFEVPNLNAAESNKSRDSDFVSGFSDQTSLNPTGTNTNISENNLNSTTAALPNSGSTKAGNSTFRQSDGQIQLSSSDPSRNDLPVSTGPSQKRRITKESNESSSSSSSDSGSGSYSGSSDSGSESGSSSGSDSS